MTTAARDAVLGVLAVALAVLYFEAARALPVSMLSDAVGPGGVPMVIAAVMGLSGLALVARAVLTPRAGEEPEDEVPAHLSAAGLLALLVGYVLALPWLGYPVAIGLLAALVAAYAGARGAGGPLLFGIGAAALAWLSFAWALNVSFPPGRLFGEG